MSNKFYSDNFEKPQIPEPPKPGTKGITVPAPSFPQYPDTEQKGLGSV